MVNTSSHKALAGAPVLVTGAAGFIGSHLVRKLLGLGCDVWVILRRSSDCWRIADVCEKLQIVHCDLENSSVDSLSADLPSNVRFVFHLAAAGVRQTEQDNESILTTNVLGTLRLLQWGKSNALDRFVYSGSCFEYGSGERIAEDVLPRPTSEYAASKSAAWLLVNAFYARYGLPTVSMRPFTVFGPWEGGHRLVPHTVMSSLRADSIELTGGEQTRDFVYVEDAVDAFLRAATESEAIGETFNICTGNATSVKELVQLIVEATGQKASPRFGIIPYRDNELWSLSGDPSKAREKLGWIAEHTLEEALAETIQWFMLPQNQVLYDGC